MRDARKATGADAASKRLSSRANTDDDERGACGECDNDGDCCDGCDCGCGCFSPRRRCSAVVKAAGTSDSPAAEPRSEPAFTTVGLKSSRTAITAVGLYGKRPNMPSAMRAPPSVALRYVTKPSSAFVSAAAAPATEMVR